MTSIKISNSEYINADIIKRIYYSSGVKTSRKDGSSDESPLLNDDLLDNYLTCSIWAEVRNNYESLLCCKKFPANKIVKQIEKERLKFLDETSFKLHLQGSIVNDPKLIEKMDELLETTINIIESAKKSDVAILDLNKII